MGHAEGEEPATACGTTLHLAPAPETFYEFTTPRNGSQKWKTK